MKLWASFFSLREVIKSNNFDGLLFIASPYPATNAWSFAGILETLPIYGIFSIIATDFLCSVDLLQGSPYSLIF
jgi:hypothetical protein